MFVPKEGDSSINWSEFFRIGVKLNLERAESVQTRFKGEVSVQFSHSVVSNSLQPHEAQHARPPCPSPTPGAHPNSCPLSWWCHPAISSSVIPFSSCPQSLPASGSFPMSQLFAWGGQSIRVSASAWVLPMNTQDWSPLAWAGWISLQLYGNSKQLEIKIQLIIALNNIKCCGISLMAYV